MPSQEWIVGLTEQLIRMISGAYLLNDKGTQCTTQFDPMMQYIATICVQKLW